MILDELKTKAAERNIPLPTCLAECLKEAKANSTSEYVVANRDGEPLSYTQFKAAVAVYCDANRETENGPANWWTENM